jgi:hypothetical protein
MSPFAVVFHSDMCSGFENIIIWRAQILPETLSSN